LSNAAQPCSFEFTYLQLSPIKVNGVELLFLLLRIGKPSMENLQLL